MNFLRGLDQVIHEVELQKFRNKEFLHTLVSVASQMRGRDFASWLMKRLIAKEHFGSTFLEQLQYLGTNNQWIEPLDVANFYARLKADETLQTDNVWATFAFICIKKHLDGLLKQFQEEFKEASELPTVRAMMAKAYLYLLHNDSTPAQEKLAKAWALLQPIENHQDNPTVWSAFFAYHLATENIAKIREMISSVTFLSSQKYSEEDLFLLLEGAAMIGNPKKAEEIAALLPSDLKAGGQLAIAYARSGNYRRACEILDQIPETTEEHYLHIHLNLPQNMPLSDRLELLSMTNNRGFHFAEAYLAHLESYYQNEGKGKDNSVLKQCLAQMNELNLPSRMNEVDYGQLLSLCIACKDKDTFLQFFNELRRKFPNSNDSEKREMLHQQALEAFK
jgi:tetratricopeptide (TPR) repeat protein